MNDIESIIAQLEQERGAIDRALLALREVVGTSGAGKRRGRPPAAKGRGGMSVEGRARIGEATRRRWAEKRAAEAGAGKKRPAKKTKGAKRNMSAEGRARIAEAARKRWAAQKAAKET